MTIYKFQCNRCFIVSGRMSSNLQDAPTYCDGEQMIAIAIESTLPEKDRIQHYLNNFDSASVPHFAPGCIYHGKSGALRFARELGYGIPDTKEGRSAVNATYSLLVKHTFTTNVPVNAAEFFTEVRWAMRHAQMPATTIADLEARMLHREYHMRELEKKL